jgi:hypothetical protein
MPRLPRVCLSCGEVWRYNRPVRHRYNREPIDLPPVVAVLHAAQTALDLANRRVKELESVCETLNEQLSESHDRADAAELTRWQSQMLDEAGQVALNKRAAPRARRASPAHRNAH